MFTGPWLDSLLSWVLKAVLVKYIPSCCLRGAPVYGTACRPDMASACLVNPWHHVMSYSRIPQTLLPFVTSTEFLSVYSWLVHPANITKNSGYYRDWAEHKSKQAPTGPWCFEWGGILTHIRPTPLIFLLRKLRPRKMKCSTSNGLSASYCPSWCEGLFLKCGGAGQNSTWGPLVRDGLTPLWGNQSYRARVFVTQPCRHRGVVLWDLGGAGATEQCFVAPDNVCNLTFLHRPCWTSHLL